MSNIKKNLSIVKEKLKRSQSGFRSSNSGLYYTKWQDTKKLLLRAIHADMLTEELKKCN